MLDKSAGRVAGREYRLSLAYDAARDGWSPAAFHGAVDASGDDPVGNLHTAIELSLRNGTVAPESFATTSASSVRFASVGSGVCGKTPRGSP